ncbi:hypothetical protein QUF72_10790 [Desulfobacterales bacterium HSG2]|nr:hypothetical protein [Desulfobacterales bacterium HSG2]
MPVSRLYCEGVYKGPDTRVLLRILDRIDIVPIGTKHGLAKRTLGAKNISESVACLRDRDFDFDEDLSLNNTPHPWCVKDNDKEIKVGWYWERKEIENYLIDPEVVRRVFGFTGQQLREYNEALRKSAKRIANYTAARITLSHSRRRILPLDNFWGEEKDDGYHHFPKEKGLKKQNCYSMTLKNVQTYNERLNVPKENIREKFEQLCRECDTGGERFQNFLTFFSGKDLLYGMRDSLKKVLSLPATKPLVKIFLERILKGLEETEEDVWTWIPEWEQLRELIHNYRA